MADFLKLYGMHFNNPAASFSYPTDPVDQLIQPLLPTQTPLERLLVLNNLAVYNKDYSFFTYKPEQTAALFEQIRQAPDYEGRLKIAFEKYDAHLNYLIQTFQARMDEELKKRNSFNPFTRPNKDYLLLLAQHLNDLQAARDGNGYHAVTVELKILASYAYYGPDYLKPFPKLPTDPGTTNRAVEPPDTNLFFYTSGFLSDWQAAAREAYITGYKMGYRLSDIYFFSYVPDSAEAVQLSEVMDRSGVFAGDARILTDLQGQLNSAKGEDIARINQQIQALLDKNNGRLRRWAFTSEQNLSAKLYEKSQAVAAQLHTILANLPSEQTGRKINLMGNSQGSAVLAGFLLQKNPVKTSFLLDNQLNDFVDKYVLNIGAHGGSFLAETKKISGETGFWYNVAATAVNLLAKNLPQLAPIQFAQKVLASSATQDLAVSSDFVAGNYAALAPENLAETSANLKNHSGLEIYNANDDVTTSLPLLSLPSTVQVRMMPGRHGISTEGSGDGAYAVLNKYIYPFFKGEAAVPSLESDQLAYCGYIKKGLADMQVDVSDVPLPGFLRSLKPILSSDRFKSSLLPFVGGQSGVIDYAVEEKVYAMLNTSLKRKKPAYWPSPRFHSFKP